MSLKKRVVRLEIQIQPAKDYDSICRYFAAQIQAAERREPFPEPPPGVDPVSCPEAFIFGRNQQEWDACMLQREKELRRMMGDA